MTLATHYAGEQRPTGRSSRLWKGCPDAALFLGNPGLGYFHGDDFRTLPTGRYTATAATAGTFALTDSEYGVARLDAGSTTTTQGINVQENSTVGENAVITLGKRFWYETRLNSKDAEASVPDGFFGLSTIDTTIIASGANSSANHIGFELINEDLTLDFVTEVGGTRTTYADVHTFVPDEFVALGFYYDGSRLDLYVNDTKVTTIAGANVPVAVEMVQSMVCQVPSAADAAPTVDVDWWYFAKLF